MDFSRMKHRISIESIVSDVDDEWGSTGTKWEPHLKRISAEVQDVLPSKDESVKNGVVFGARKARIRMRYRLGIDSSMRIIIHGAQDRLMQIIGGPAVLGNKESLEILCEEVTTDVNN